MKTNVVDHVNPKIKKISRKFAHFPSPPTPRKITPTKFLSTLPLKPTKERFSVYNPIKTAFLAVGIAPAPLF